jgi:SAM-dependent methyltransferase
MSPKYYAKALLRPRYREGFLLTLPRNAKILDVGCGNNSPWLTKKILPGCEYTGVDVGDYNQAKPNLADRYVLTTAAEFPAAIAGLGPRFDAVISSHNIEHCDDRAATLQAMVSVLKPGGRLYLAFPSEASVHFPRRTGTLNYYDDPTHTTVPPALGDLRRNLQSDGLRILFSAEQYRPPAMWLLGWMRERSSAREDRVVAGTWAYHGFESILWAQRPQA